MTETRQWQIIAIATLLVVLAAGGAFLWRSSALEAAVRDCVMASDVADRIPSIGGESAFRVEIVDLVLYRSVETSLVGERTEDVDAVIDSCVEAIL